ncbi:MAG: TolC family protein [Acidobacteriota bacterium]|jgi:outer membrane protein TolC
MRTFDVSPCRGNRYKWLSVLVIFTISLVLTSAPPWGAFAQDQQQAQAAKPPEQQATPPPQEVNAITPITLVPVSLESPIAKAEKDGTALHLSMRDVVKLALQNNLNIAIADTNEDVRLNSILSARGAFDPTFRASLGLTNSNRPNNNTTTASATGFVNTNQNATWNITLGKQMPFGGSASLQWNSGRSDSNVVTSIFNPQYSDSATFSYTQPLWRNFRIDSYRNAIKVANLNVLVNDSQFRDTLTTTISQIETSYWDLVSAIKQYEVSANSVELARTSAAQAKKKVEVGTSAPIEYTQSLASQAQRELSVINAEQTILNAENSLRNLISKDRTADIWGQVIVPTDPPDYIDYKVDLNQAITTAMKNSPQLQQDDYTTQSDDLGYDLLQNSKKWQFDLNAGVGANGQAGPQSFDRNGNPQVADPYVGGLFTAYRTLFNQGNYNWNVGFSITIPLKNTDLNAQMASQRITKQQHVMTRSQHEQSLIVSVRNAVQSLATAKKQLETAKIGTQLSTAQLDAESKRLDAGLSTQLLVLQAQDSLNTAQNTELNAMITYRKAIITLQRTIYTLLSESNIDLGTTKTGARFK